MSTPTQPGPTSVAEYCPQSGSDLPRRFRIELPQALQELSGGPRRRRARWTADDAVLDDCRFFARGRLRLPIQGESEPLCYDCWVELGERENLVLACAAKETDRETLAPLSAELANSLPPFYDTVGLGALLVLRPLDQPPDIVLRAPSRLTELQHDGLTLAEFHALAIDLLHGHRGALANLKT